MPKMAKIAKWSQILWMIQIFFGKNFLHKKFLNGPIQKVTMLKVKFEEPQNLPTFQTSIYPLAISCSAEHEKHSIKHSTL